MAKKQQSLKELQRIWYAKLKQSGFVDIEKKNGQLMSPTSSNTFLDRHSVFRKMSDENRLETALTARQALEDYYRLARQFLHDFQFKKPYHKKVWELHSEGYPHKGIALKLNLSVATVKTVVYNHKEYMLGFRVGNPGEATEEGGED